MADMYNDHPGHLAPNSRPEERWGTPRELRQYPHCPRLLCSSASFQRKDCKLTETCWFLVTPSRVVCFRLLAQNQLFNFFRTNISRQVYDKVSALFSKMLEGDLNSKLTSLRAFKTLIMSCDPVIKIRYIRSVSPAFFELFFAYQVILIADRENHRINRSKTRLRFSHFFTFESLSRVLSPYKYNNILKLFFAESESCSRRRFNGY